MNAKNTIGEGAVSNDPSETPGDEPSPARSLAITHHHNELVVTWQEPADDGGFPITGYAVQWETGGTTQEAALAAGTLMHSIQGLQSETSYTVLVISTNAIGDDIDDLDAGEVRAQITISTRPGLPASRPSTSPKAAMMSLSAPLPRRLSRSPRETCGMRMW